MLFQEIAAQQHTKTKPMEYAEFEACLDWWNGREANDHAWKSPFAENLSAALEKAQPHWDAAEQAKQQAAGLEKQLKEVEKQLAELERASAAKKEITAAKRGRTALLNDIGEQRQRQKDEQAAGDGIYWPLFNLDIKNPSSLEALEHRAPEELIGDMLEKERRVMGIMEALRVELSTTEGERHA